MHFRTDVAAAKGKSDPGLTEADGTGVAAAASISFSGSNFI